jgi:hypothetical protein
MDSARIPQLTGEDMVRRLQNPPPADHRPWATVAEKRDARCPECLTVYTNTKRSFCPKCDRYFDA